MDLCCGVAEAAETERERGEGRGRTGEGQCKAVVSRDIYLSGRPGPQPPSLLVPFPLVPSLSWGWNVGAPLNLLLSPSASPTGPVDQMIRGAQSVGRAVHRIGPVSQSVSSCQSNNLKRRGAAAMLLTLARPLQAPTSK